MVLGLSWDGPRNETGNIWDYAGTTGKNLTTIKAYSQQSSGNIRDYLGLSGNILGLSHDENGTISGTIWEYPGTTGKRPKRCYFSMVTKIKILVL